VSKIWLVAGVALALTLSGCGSTSQGTGGPAGSTVDGSASSATAGSDGGSVATTDSASDVGFQVSPEADTKHVRLDEPVVVKVGSGTLSQVEVRSPGGTVLDGALGDQNTSWTSTGHLSSATTYTVQAQATDTDGKVQQFSSKFTTLKPSSRVSAAITPGDGWTVGVGMPVIIDFSHAVALKNRDAVVKALSVTTTPAVTGAWRWFSSEEIQWRPQNYWTSGTKVVVKADLADVEVSPGVWGRRAFTHGFTIGSSVIDTVDMKKHTLTMRVAGKVVKVLPVTTGKPGLETRTGIKVIISRELSRNMDAATTGVDPKDPEYYNIKDVKFAMRLTFTGEFLHAAPWSVAYQGHANVSHGCTGMSLANAQWLYEHSKVGDVVVYTGSKRKLEWGNGYTAWNMSFSSWAAGS